MWEVLCLYYDKAIGAMSPQRSKMLIVSCLSQIEAAFEAFVAGYEVEYNQLNFADKRDTPRPFVQPALAGICPPKRRNKE